MIGIDFDPSRLNGDEKRTWSEWLARAEEATHGILKEWENKKELKNKDFKNDIWRELKKWLLDHVFHGKCAYCETHLETARQPGDADHYRPKGGVNYKHSESNNKKYITAMTVDKFGVRMKHPGYFRLAYDWRNILPACKFCNSGGGKKNQFPIKNSAYVFVEQLDYLKKKKLKGLPYKSPEENNTYYLASEDLDEIEEPYLLHPYRDNPLHHVGFDDSGGVYAKEIDGEKSLKGLHSIEVYDLKNEHLRQARQYAQQTAFTKFNAALNHFYLVKKEPLGDAIEKARRENEIQKILNGQTPYSAAVIDNAEKIFQKP